MLAILMKTYFDAGLKELANKAGYPTKHAVSLHSFLTKACEALSILTRIWTGIPATQLLQL